MDRPDKNSYETAKAQFIEARDNLVGSPEQAGSIKTNWDNDYTKHLGKKEQFEKKLEKFIADTNTHIEKLDGHQKDIAKVIGEKMANENREAIFRLGASIMNTLKQQLHDLNEDNNPYVDKDVKIAIVKNIPDTLKAVTNTLENYLTPRQNRPDNGRGR